MYFVMAFILSFKIVCTDTSIKKILKSLCPNKVSADILKLDNNNYNYLIR
jgi:hypothetical protein